MKKQLDSLRIKRFRQIKELSIPELGHVNLIVGGNKTGKSALLEALRFFAGRAAPSLLEELLGLRGELQAVPQRKEATPLTAGSAEALCNLFFGRKFPEEDGAAIYVGSVSGGQFVQLEHVYHLGATRDGKVYEGGQLSASELRILSKKDDDPSWYAIEAVQIRTSAHPGTPVLDLDKLFDGHSPGARYERQVPKVPCSYVASGVPVHAGLAEAWDNIVLTELEQTALQALRIIEPQAERLAFVQQAGPTTMRLSAVRSLSEERIAVLKLRGQDNPVPLRSMGDGMVRVLQLVLGALEGADGLLLIDEFENGLHFSVQTKVWEILFDLVQKRGLQIFATTHSNDCVRAFCEVALANKEVDGKLLKMERMPEDGQTVASVLGEVSLSNLLDAGIEVRG
jgi:hypothetical protein